MKASEQANPSVAKWTRAFKTHVATIAPERLVFIDESGATMAMTRTYGRAPRGKRVYGRVPRNPGKLLTMLGALSPSGLIALGTIDDATSIDVFTAYVEQILIPELQYGQVVVMDNLSAHRSPKVRALIEAAGASVLYLPPYSPELNPIEFFWSWLKTHLRRIQARTRQVLDDAIVACMDMLPTSHVENWYRECGYGQ